MSSLEEKIQKLVEKREQLRKEKKYQESDAARAKLREMGYTVADEEDETRVFKEERLAPKESFLVLFGSGETAPSAQKVHDHVLKKIGKKRFEKMLAMLPVGKEIWGIDEHTAAIIDLKTKQCTPMGKGKIWNAR